MTNPSFWRRQPNPFGRRRGTIERAYELARSGECSGVTQIKRRLEGEDYDDVRTQVYGGTLIHELQRLCFAAKTNWSATRPKL